MRHREVELGASEVEVPHVGGKPGEENLDVRPLAVPLDEPVYGKAVPEIVDTDVEQTVAWLGDADLLAGPPEGFLHELSRDEASHSGRKQRLIV